MAAHSACEESINVLPDVDDSPHSQNNLRIISDTNETGHINSVLERFVIWSLFHY